METTVLRGADTLSYAFALGEDGKFGFYPLLTANAYELATQKYTLAEAIPAGIEMGIGQLGSYVKQLKLLFSQGDTAYKSVGGMASIANIFPGVLELAFFLGTDCFDLDHAGRRKYSAYTGFGRRTCLVPVV